MCCRDAASAGAAYDANRCSSSTPQGRTHVQSRAQLQQEQHQQVPGGGVAARALLAREPTIMLAEARARAQHVDAGQVGALLGSGEGVGLGHGESGCGRALGTGGAWGGAARGAFASCRARARAPLASGRCPRSPLPRVRAAEPRSRWVTPSSSPVRTAEARCGVPLRREGSCSRSSAFVSPTRRCARSTPLARGRRSKRALPSGARPRCSP